MTDNRLQRLSKLFAAVTVRLGIKQLRTTAYHIKTDGQVETSYRTMVELAGHYVSEHQTT